MFFYVSFNTPNGPKGSCITHDRKKLIIFLSAKVLKLISNKLQQFNTNYIAFQIYDNDHTLFQPLKNILILLFSYPYILTAIKNIHE